MPMNAGRVLSSKGIVCRLVISMIHHMSNRGWPIIFLCCVWYSSNLERWIRISLYIPSDDFI